MDWIMENDCELYQFSLVGNNEEEFHLKSKSSLNRKGLFINAYIYANHPNWTALYKWYNCYYLPSTAKDPWSVLFMNFIW